MGHAHAVVADGDGAGVGVGVDPDLEVLVVAEQVRVGERPERQLVQRVAGVADQLPQEDLLVLVERVHDQAEHLAHLGLERVLLGLLRHVLPPEC